MAEGKIADLLAGQGKPDEAMALHEKRLKVFEKLGDVRSAAAEGKIADLLAGQGKPAEAMAIYKRELEAYTALGDVRSAAVAEGKIADLLAGQGKLAEALKIYREKVLPVSVLLGDIQGQVVCRVNIAVMLLMLGEPADLPEAREHLVWALEEAKRMQLAEVPQIEQILARALGQG